jgi:hypothetical protein
MVTEGSPFSMRCNVTRDIPAASAATVALTRKALRLSATRAPKLCSLVAVFSVTIGDFLGILFLIVCKKSFLSIMRNNYFAIMESNAPPIRRLILFLS